MLDMTCRKFLINALKFGLLSLAFLLIATGPQPANADTSAYGQACIDAWEDAPAYTYCSSATVARIGASTAGDTGHCRIHSYSCAITANVGNTSTNWTAYIRLTVPLADTSTLDLCFRVHSDGDRYAVEAKTACATGDTTSAAATSDGLPALEQSNSSSASN